MNEFVMERSIRRARIENLLRDKYPDNFYLNLPLADRLFMSPSLEKMILSHVRRDPKCSLIRPEYLFELIIPGVGISFCYDVTKLINTSIQFIDVLIVVDKFVYRYPLNPEDTMRVISIVNG